MRVCRDRELEISVCDCCCSRVSVCDIDVDKFLFSLLNISEQHSIVIFHSFDLFSRSLIAVLAVNIQDFEKVS